MKSKIFTLLIVILIILNTACEHDSPVKIIPTTGSLILQVNSPDSAQSSHRSRLFKPGEDVNRARILIYDSDIDTIEKDIPVLNPSFTDTINNIPYGNNRNVFVRVYNNDYIVYEADAKLSISAGGIQYLKLILEEKWGTVSDMDGNVYKTVRIGDQIWMAENLRVKHYQNGDAIEYVTTQPKWKILKSGAYCYCNNSISNSTIYGLLYNFYAVMDSRNIAPLGWKVASDSDWSELENYLGSNAGCQLKIVAPLVWVDISKCQQEVCGFNALPAGFRDASDSNFFLGIGSSAYFWTWSNNKVYFRYIRSDDSKIFNAPGSQKIGLSVRCIKE